MEGVENDIFSKSQLKKKSYSILFQDFLDFMKQRFYNYEYYDEI